MKDRVTAAAVHKTFRKTTRVTNKAIIFRTELYATSLAMVLNYHSKENNFIIFSAVCLALKL